MNTTIGEKYVQHQYKKWSEISFRIFYEKSEKQYKVTATPCNRSNRDGVGIKEFECMTGFIDRLTKVETRRSKKTDDQAIDMFNSKLEKYMQYFKE